MVNINKYIKVLLHPAGGHQGSHKAHQAGNHSLIHPNVGKVHMLHIRKGIGHNKLVRVHSFACLYQPKHRWWHVSVMGIPPPAPLPHPLWQNFPMCPVTGSSSRLKMAHTARLAFSSRKNLFRARRPGPCQRRRCDKALQMLWQGPGRRAPKRFFLDPSTTRRQHLSAVLIREAILGRVTV